MKKITNMSLVELKNLRIKLQNQLYEINNAIDLKNKQSYYETGHGWSCSYVAREFCNLMKKEQNSIEFSRSAVACELHHSPILRERISMVWAKNAKNDYNTRLTACARVLMEKKNLSTLRRLISTNY